MDIFSSPCGFDDEDGFFVEFLHGDAEHEFGADRVLAGSEASG
jgi:hypothetical protein